VIGTYNLLECLKKHSTKKIVHVSTDEVFGELELNEDPFSESTQIKPRSPYAATKASSDHIAFAYAHTYGMNISVTNCSNNFGPNQHEEKLIPATIKRLYNNKPIRLYGTGTNIRDWLYVEDHCKALQVVEEHGKPGERYCIGGDLEMTNIEITNVVANEMIKKMGPIKLSIEFTNDRPTDDKRYAINSSKLKSLGWEPSKNLEKNIGVTIDYYLKEKKEG
ncbi:MAG: dTDP-glucose 4,6-dehydratase, partial [Flavobacteriaceae bacterium]